MGGFVFAVDDARFLSLEAISPITARPSRRSLFFFFSLQSFEKETMLDEIRLSKEKARREKTSGRKRERDPKKEGGRSRRFKVAGRRGQRGRTNGRRGEDGMGGQDRAIPFCIRTREGIE